MFIFFRRWTNFFVFRHGVARCQMPAVGRIHHEDAWLKKAVDGFAETDCFDRSIYTCQPVTSSFFFCQSCYLKGVKMLIRCLRWGARWVPG